MKCRNVLPTLYTFAHEAYRFCISTLPFPGEGRIVQAGQRVWMVLYQLLLARLLHLYLQLFGRIRSALIPVSRGQIGYAVYRGVFYEFHLLIFRTNPGHLDLISKIKRAFVYGIILILSQVR